MRVPVVCGWESGICFGLPRTDRNNALGASCVSGWKTDQWNIVSGVAVERRKGVRHNPCSIASKLASGDLTIGFVVVCSIHRFHGGEFRTGFNGGRLAPCRRILERSR